MVNLLKRKDIIEYEYRKRYIKDYCIVYSKYGWFSGNILFIVKMRCYPSMFGSVINVNM
jgi:hypothetical protein